MIWENRQLVNIRLKFKATRKVPIIFLPQFNKRKTGRRQRVAGWTCKHLDVNRLCPKNLPDHWAAQPAFGQPGKVKVAIRSLPSNSEGGDSLALHPQLSLCLNQGLGLSLLKQHNYECVCIIAVLYLWYYTTVLYNTPKPYRV